MKNDREWNKFTLDNSSAGSFRGKCKKKDKRERSYRKVLKFLTFLPIFLLLAYFPSLTYADPAPNPFAQVPKPSAPVPKPKPAAPAPKPTAPVPKSTVPVPKPKPAAPAPKPTAPVPKSVVPIPRPKPVAPVPKPKPAAPAPKPTAPVSKSTVPIPRPKPVAPVPKPKSTVPAPKPTAPVPKSTVPIPRPKPVAPVPKPKPAAPVPKPKSTVPAPKPTAPGPKPLLVGTKKMLIIPLKFSDHMERVVPSKEHLTMIMNNGVAHKQLCPSGSVQDYFLVNSFDLLKLDSTVAPWVNVPKTEAYYGNGSSGYNNNRSHMLIRDALEALEATDFDFTPFDTDNNGYIDAVGFFHSGYDGVFQKPDIYGTGHLYRIKSHSGNLYSLQGGKWTSSSGISVTKYHISSTFDGTTGTEIVPIGTVVYQIARYFGIPSLDDTLGFGGGEGLGRYCLMGTGYLGWDGSRRRPTQMSAWSKIQAGWVAPISITSAGLYSARQACAFPDVFKISTKFTAGEYLLIENRYPCNYDTDIPGPGGLAIYHIDESKPDNNDVVYPDPNFSWPQNGKHYRVALLPAHGLMYLETRETNVGDNLDSYFGDYLFGRASIMIGPDGIRDRANNVVSSLINTNTYKNGIINSTCITITVRNTQIQYPSENMYFDVSFKCTS